MSMLERCLIIIDNYYQDERAERSGVLKMNHIHEGVAILQAIGADDETQGAFCLHPITQNESDYHLPKNGALSLAEEYAYYANSYLCTPENFDMTQLKLSEITKGMSKQCAQMLYADKIQNRKDFNLYHKGSHPKSDQLERYFDLWINYLSHLI